MADHLRTPHADEISRDAMFFICGGLIGALIGFAVGIRAAHAEDVPKVEMWTTLKAVGIANGCALASVAPDDRVTIDWPCVDRSLKGEHGTVNHAIALVLKAARETGKADK